MRFISDVHGNHKVYKKLIEGYTESIQVGDMGIGFGMETILDREEIPNGHRFIRGNHDNPSLVHAYTDHYVPDGTVEGDMMFIGGAWSIDKDMRIPGVDWWRDEELSYPELDKLITKYEEVKPRVMVTHDCPTLAAYHLFVKPNENLLNQRVLILSRTGEALQAMFEIHQPEVWIFGHWHRNKDEVINGTRFICMRENTAKDIDL